MERSTKRLAVSLVALLAILGFFATLSAAARGLADNRAPIINPAIDDDGYRNVYELGPLLDVGRTAIGFAGRAAPVRSSSTTSTPCRRRLVATWAW